MSKCSCYHTKEVRRYTFHPLTRAPIPHDETVGVCSGTKEVEECSCGGDAAKCDFYPEKRKKAQSVADVVEVVRCNDCKYCKANQDYHGNGHWHCKKAYGFPEVDPFDYCSYGRKGGEEE